VTKISKLKLSIFSNWNLAKEYKVRFKDRKSVSVIQYFQQAKENSEKVSLYRKTHLANFNTLSWKYSQHTRNKREFPETDKGNLPKICGYYPVLRWKTKDLLLNLRIREGCLISLPLFNFELAFSGQYLRKRNMIYELERKE
jgi:hypothetical protein